MKFVRYIMTLGMFLALALVGLGTVNNSASAVVPTPDCTPSNAWTQHVNHIALTHTEYHGAETKIVRHDEVTKVVHHPAVTVVTHHKAEFVDLLKFERKVDTFKTQWHFVKYTRTKTKSKNGSWSAYGAWEKWLPITHESWEDTNVDGLGTPAFHSQGVNKDGSEWYREWQARNTGETKQVKTGTKTETTDWVESKPAGDGWVQVDYWHKQVKDAYDEVTVTSPAWDETVLVTSAWDEIVVIKAAYTSIVVDQPAWTETIYHPAKTCAATDQHFTPHVRVIDRCRCRNDTVKVRHDGRIQFSKISQVNKTTWKVRLVAEEGYLLPKNIKRPSAGWARTVTYKFHTTNKPCPCEKTGCKAKAKPKPKPCACPSRKI